MIPYFESEFPEEDAKLEEKIVNIKRRIKNNPEKIELFKEYAQLLLVNINSENIKEAEKSIRRYLQVGDNNNDNTAMIIMMKIMRLSDRFNEALNISKQLEKDNQNNADYLEQTGRIYFNNDNLDEAKRFLESAHKKFPTHNGLSRILANVLTELGETTEALILLEQVRGRDPANPRNTYYLIALLFELGERKKAIRMGETFCEEYETEAFQQLTITGIESVAFNLGYYYHKQGISLRGENHLRFADERLKKQKITYISNLGNEAEEYFDKACRVFDKILKIKTQTASIENVLTWKLWSLLNLEKFEEANAICDELILNIKENIFENMDIYRVRITIMTFLQRYEKVIKYSEEFIEKYIQYEDNVEVEKQTYFILEHRLAAYYNSGQLEKFTEEQKRMEERYGAEAERKKLNNSVQVPDTFLNSPGNTLKTVKWMKQLFEEFKETVCYVDHYIMGKHIQFLDGLLDFETIKFKEIRFVGKFSENGDGGADWYSKYKSAQFWARMFNQDHKSKCKITLNYYIPDKDEGKIHDRIFFDNKLMYFIPGMQQIMEGDLAVWTKIKDQCNKDEVRKVVRSRNTKTGKEMFKEIEKYMESKNEKICDQIQTKINSSDDMK